MSARVGPRATPSRTYGARIAVEVEARRREGEERPQPRPPPKLKRHPLGMAYCAFKVRGRRRWYYFGPWGSRAARAKWNRFLCRWPAQLDEPPPAGKWSVERALTTAKIEPRLPVRNRLAR